MIFSSCPIVTSRRFRGKDTYLADGEEEFDEAASDLLGDEAGVSGDEDIGDEDWDLEDEDIA